MFASAQQAEVIRSNQKDEYYSGFIKSQVTDVIQTLFGPRAWMKWKKELYLAADLGYFALTTLSGYQTLGEEYVTVVQTDQAKRHIPSAVSRLGMVLLQVAAPYAIDRLLWWVEKEFQQNMRLNVDTRTRAKVLEVIPVIRNVVTIVHRCHLAWFYMRGIFYHIAKRITGIHYTLVRDVSHGESESNFRILGWLSVIQLSLTFIYQGYKLLKMRNAVSGQKEKEADDAGSVNIPKIAKQGTQAAELISEPEPGRRCDLCLENRKQSTATPCGHLFCWTCITEWCQTKPECPLCREEFDMSRLIFLKNFDPV